MSTQDFKNLTNAIIERSSVGNGRNEQPFLDVDFVYKFYKGCPWKLSWRQKHIQLTYDEQHRNQVNYMCI